MSMLSFNSISSGGYYTIQMESNLEGLAILIAEFALFRADAKQSFIESTQK